MEGGVLFPVAFCISTHTHTQQRERERERERERMRETDQLQCQKRPITVSKETHAGVSLIINSLALSLSLSHTLCHSLSLAKETYYRGKRDLHGGKRDLLSHTLSHTLSDAHHHLNLANGLKIRTV
jgi:hypothetical protein